MTELIYQACAVLGAVLGTIAVVLMGIVFEVCRDNQGPRGPIGPPGPPGPLAEELEITLVEGTSDRPVAER